MCRAATRAACAGSSWALCRVAHPANIHALPLHPTFHLHAPIKSTCMPFIFVCVVLFVCCLRCSEENHDEDPELQVLQAATSGSSPAAERLRQAIYAQGRPLINAAVQEFVGELRAGGPMRPQAAGAAATGSSAVAVGGAPPAGKPAAAPPAQEAAPKADQLQQPAPAPAAAQAAAGDSSSGSISLSSKFYASARDLYECFTDPRRMMAYTRAPVEAQPQLGGRLSMYGGSIEGTYVELVPEEQVVLDWRFKEWQAGVFSKVGGRCNRGRVGSRASARRGWGWWWPCLLIAVCAACCDRWIHQVEEAIVLQVVISITEKTKGSTSVKIEQSGIPETDRFGHHDCTGNAKEGWERLLRQIKVVFGYGV